MIKIIFLSTIDSFEVQYNAFYKQLYNLCQLLFALYYLYFSN